VAVLHTTLHNETHLLKHFWNFAIENLEGKAKRLLCLPKKFKRMSFLRNAEATAIENLKPKTYGAK
jgi:hypothetical protein